MPNWCSNRIEIRPANKSKEAKKQFSEFLKNIKANFETNEIEISGLLNFLVPMPEELNIHSGSLTDSSLAVYLSLNENNHTAIDEMLAYLWVKEKGIKTREDLIIEMSTNKQFDMELGKKAADNIKKHGFPTWYGWKIKNWGTKWDIKEVYVNILSENKLNIEFDTAWSPPLQAFVTASKKDQFNKLSFKVKYAEPMMGSGGTMEVVNGEYSHEAERCDDYLEEFDGE